MDFSLKFGLTFALVCVIIIGLRKIAVNIISHIASRFIAGAPAESQYYVAMAEKT